VKLLLLLVQLLFKAVYLGLVFGTGLLQPQRREENVIVYT